MHHAPAAAASAEVAVVPSSRSRGGRSVRRRRRAGHRGSACGSWRRAGVPRAWNRSVAASTSQFCSAVLENPMPGSRRSAPARCRPRRPGPLLDELAHHVVHHVDVLGALLHRDRVRASAHGVYAPRRDHPEHRVVRAAARDVVDQPHPRAARLGHLGTHRVDRDPGAVGREPRDQRQDPVDLLLDTRWVAPGRVDSPPTSMMSAPSATSRRAWARAVGSTQRPRRRTSRGSR